MHDDYNKLLDELVNQEENLAKKRKKIRTKLLMSEIMGSGY